MGLAEVESPSPDRAALDNPNPRNPNPPNPALRTPDLGTPDLGTPDLGTPDGRTPDLRTPDLGNRDGVDLHAQSHSELTGGDLFDAVRVGSRLAFLLADIAGRRPELNGIAAEMQRVFRASTTELFSAADVNLMEVAETLILAINHALITAAHGVRFTPTVLGCYDIQLGILAYINAGGQSAFFRDSEGTRALPNVSVPLGLFTHMTYDASIQAFEPGAMLLLATKGVTDILGDKHSFGPEDVAEVLRSSNFEAASDLCRAVLDASHQYKKDRREWLPFKSKPMLEDRTALAMIRTV